MYQFCARVCNKEIVSCHNLTDRYSVVTLACGRTELPDIAFIEVNKDYNRRKRAHRQHSYQKTMF